MIRYYFALQHKIIQRHLIDWGITPIIAYPLGIAAFTAFSFYLFAKMEWAAEVYTLLGFSALSALGTTKRNEFMQSFISKNDFYFIRLAENLILLFPFVFFLILKSEWIYSGVITVVGALMSRINSGFSLSKSIPTPFSKSPFEFPVGFRKTAPVILLSYGITLIGLKVGNFNLAAFSLGLVFFISVTYYSFLERPEYVWIYSENPRTFLLLKIKIAILNALILTIPILLLLCIFEFSNLFQVILILITGELFLVATVLSKYTAYPREMNVPNGILLGISLLFPPLLLVLIPFFYNQSLTSLKKVLL